MTSPIEGVGEVGGSPGKTGQQDQQPKVSGESMGGGSISQSLELAWEVVVEIDKADTRAGSRQWQ